MKLYDRLRQACEDRDTTLTSVLKAIGRSDGNTGSWKAGKSPKLDIIMEIAEYLHMSLDELVYGKTAAAARQPELSPSQIEWLEIIDRIPADKQQMCKDFLRTHIVEPEKYLNKKSV